MRGPERDNQHSLRTMVYMGNLKDRVSDTPYQVWSHVLQSAQKFGICA